MTFDHICQTLAGLPRAELEFPIIPLYSYEFASFVSYWLQSKTLLSDDNKKIGPFVYTLERTIISIKYLVPYITPLGEYLEFSWRRKQMDQTDVSAVLYILNVEYNKIYDFKMFYKKKRREKNFPAYFVAVLNHWNGNDIFLFARLHTWRTFAYLWSNIKSAAPWIGQFLYFQFIHVIHIYTNRRSFRNVNANP